MGTCSSGNLYLDRQLLRLGSNAGVYREDAGTLSAWIHAPIVFTTSPVARFNRGLCPQVLRWDLNSGKQLNCITTVYPKGSSVTSVAFVVSHLSYCSQSALHTLQHGLRMGHYFLRTLLKLSSPVNLFIIPYRAYYRMITPAH